MCAGLQVLFEEWTNDTWSAAAVITAVNSMMEPVLWPPCSPHSGSTPPEPEVICAGCSAGGDSDDDQNSAFTIAFAEIEEARRASDGLTSGSVSDGMLWAAFYPD